MAMKTRRLVTSAVVGSLSLALLVGCDSLADQGKKDPNSIIGKKTDDIKEFDPKAKQQVSESKVHVDDPILGPLQAYGPMVEQISKMYVDHAIDLFYATEGRYPKDYKEFMTRIIKENHIQLPVLPARAKYAYDVEHHKLQVILAPEGNPNPAEEPAKN
jgi:hypothetical protein